jgi:putative addiction module component (TIGR02574 family)
MPKTMDPKFYLKLSVEERLRLVDEILSSLPKDEHGSPPLGPTWDELVRRAEEFKRNPTPGMTWEEVCDKLGWRR